MKNLLIFFLGFISPYIFVYFFVYGLVGTGIYKMDYLEIEGRLSDKDLKNLSYYNYENNKKTSINTKDTMLLIYSDLTFLSDKNNINFMIESCKKSKKKYCLITEDKIDIPFIKKSYLFYQKNNDKKVYNSYYLVCNQKIYYSEPLTNKIDTNSFTKFIK